MHDKSIDILDRMEWKARESGTLADTLRWFEMYSLFCEDLFPKEVWLNIEFAAEGNFNLPVKFVFGGMSTPDEDKWNEVWSDWWQEHYLGQLVIAGTNFHCELTRVRWYKPEGDGGQLIQEEGRDPNRYCDDIWKRSDGAFETVTFPELPGEWLLTIFPHGM